MNDPQKQNKILDLPNLDTYRFENMFNVYRENDNYFYNLLTTVNFPSNIDSSYFTNYVVPYDNLSWTYISDFHYETTELWWLICSVNNIQNPTAFPRAGTVLKILNADIVTGILRSIKQT